MIINLEFGDVLAQSAIRSHNSCIMSLFRRPVQLFDISNPLVGAEWTNNSISWMILYSVTSVHPKIDA